MLKHTIEIIGKALGIRPETIKETDSFQDLRLEKKDLFGILTDLEDEYSIVLDYNRCGQLETVADLEEYVTASGAL